jgi:hypothetical protein
MSTVQMLHPKGCDPNGPDWQWGVFFHLLASQLFTLLIRTEMTQLEYADASAVA